MRAVLRRLLLARPPSPRQEREIPGTTRPFCFDVSWRNATVVRRVLSGASEGKSASSPPSPRRPRPVTLGPKEGAAAAEWHVGAHYFLSPNQATTSRGSWREGLRAVLCLWLCGRFRASHRLLRVGEGGEQTTNRPTSATPPPLCRRLLPRGSDTGRAGRRAAPLDRDCLAGSEGCDAGGARRRASPVNRQATVVGELLRLPFGCHSCPLDGSGTTRALCAQHAVSAGVGLPGPPGAVQQGRAG
ncbi:hypothetical protein ISCGN_000093 [Ixodes scapularis]